MTEPINTDDIKVTTTAAADESTGPDGQDPEGQEPTTSDDVTSTTGDGDDTGTQDDPDEVDVDKLQAEIKRLRKENAKARTGAKEQAAKEAREEALAEAEQARIKAVEDAKAEALKAFQKAMGMEPEEAAELTPEQVIEQITKERDEEKAAREQERAERLELLREAAVQDAANAHDADPSKLLDSRAFMKEIEQIDASDRNAFRAAVMEAVEKAVGANSVFKNKTKPTPPTASGGTTVAGSKTREIDDADVEELIAAGFTKRR